MTGGAAAGWSGAAALGSDRALAWLGRGRLGGAVGGQRLGKGCRGKAGCPGGGGVGSTVGGDVVHQFQPGIGIYGAAGTEIARFPTALGGDRGGIQGRSGQVQR